MIYSLLFSWYLPSEDRTFYANNLIDLPLSAANDIPGREVVNDLLITHIDFHILAITFMYRSLSDTAFADTNSNHLDSQMPQQLFECSYVRKLSSSFRLARIAKKLTNMISIFCTAGSYRAG